MESQYRDHGLLSSWSPYSARQRHGSTSTDRTSISPTQPDKSNGTDAIQVDRSDPGDEQPPPKRVRITPQLPRPTAELTLPFFQTNQPLSEPVTSRLTLEMLRGIQSDEFTDDIVMFFLMRMAQLIPSKQLRVLPPSFYHSTVVESRVDGWREFMRGNSPVVCLPVMDSGRWMLIVVASTPSRGQVFYLDSNNNDGYVPRVFMRVVRFISAAWSSTDNVTKRLVDDKDEIETATAAAHTKDFGLHVVSYFAAIVRALRGADGEAVTTPDVIKSASYDTVFTRHQLVEDTKHAWKDALETSVCWGRRPSGTWRPCMRLNLLRTTIYPDATTSAVGSARDVAVVFLFDGPNEVKWLEHSAPKPLETVQ